MTIPKDSLCERHAQGWLDTAVTLARMNREEQAPVFLMALSKTGERCTWIVDEEGTECGQEAARWESVNRPVEMST